MIVRFVYRREDEARKIAAADGAVAAFSMSDWSQIERFRPVGAPRRRTVVGKVAASEGAAERDEDPRVRQVAGGVRRANARMDSLASNA